MRAPVVSSLMSRRRLAKVGLIAILIVEGSLRASGYNDQIFTEPDPVLGYRLTPGLAQLQTLEGRALVTINVDGYRGRHYPQNRSSGSFRIVVLGDSLTEGRQVGDDETYAAVAEKELSACPALARQRVEVLNFGVAGYSNAQELLLFRHRARLWKADVVLLMVYTPNDLTDNTTGARQRHQPWFDVVNDRLIPNADFVDSRSFRLANSTPARAFAWAKRRLRVLHVFGDALRRFRNWRAPAPRRGPGGRPSYVEPEGTFKPPGRDEEWRLMERLILQLREEVSATGASFLLANAPSPHAVHPDRAYREDVQRFYDVADLDYAERRLHGLANAEGFAFVPLAASLRAEVDRSGECLNGFPEAVPCYGHWNVLGHRLVGRQVARTVCEGLTGPVERVRSHPKTP